MDLKKLSRFVIGFGAALFAIGAIWFLSNLPVKASQYQDRNATGWASVTQSFGASIAAHDENMKRQAARGSATWTMIFGVIVGLAGFAVWSSAKKNADTQANEFSGNDVAKSESKDPTAVPCPFCSKPLERGTWQTYCTHCFHHLPSETKAELARPYDGTT